MSQTQQPKLLATIGALFLAVIIDQMGITFIFPILTPLFMEPHSVIGAQISPALRDFYYGLTLALYPFFMFIGAPILGDLSDQVGRKKLLLTCLLGSAISFFVSAIAVSIGSLSLLLLSRAVAGFFGGSQFIAQAAIADISPPEKKAVNLSYIVLAISIGFVVGPLIGGFFSDVHFATWFTFATPFVVAGILAIINAALIFILFQETFTVPKEIKLQIFKGFTLFYQGFANEKVRLLSAILFLNILGFNLYFQSLSWLLFDRYHFDSNKIGLFMGYMGLAFALGLTVIIRLMVKYFKPATSLIICLLIAAIAMFSGYIFAVESTQWIIVPFFSAAIIINYAMVIALFSNAVSNNMQGWIMGVTGSVGALAWAVAAFGAGPLGYANIELPMLVSGILFICGIVFVMIYRRVHH